MEVKTDIWDIVERERRARAYIEWCALRRSYKTKMIMSGLAMVFIVLLIGLA